MNRSIAWLSISLVWFLSEIILGRVRHSKRSEAKVFDRGSLRVLWLTIMASLSAGIFIALRGAGSSPEVTPIAFPLGLAFIVIGLIIRWVAVFTLKRFFTSNVSILPDHRLITHGIYRFVRHPAYAGSLLSFFGLGLAFSNWFSMVVIFLPILMAFLYRIRVEEAALREAFGQAYQRYCQKTRRLLPGVY